MMMHPLFWVGQIVGPAACSSGASFPTCDFWVNTAEIRTEVSGLPPIKWKKMEQLWIEESFPYSCVLWTSENTRQNMEQPIFFADSWCGQYPYDRNDGFLTWKKPDVGNVQSCSQHSEYVFNGIKEKRTKLPQFPWSCGNHFHIAWSADFFLSPMFPFYQNIRRKRWCDTTKMEMSCLKPWLSGWPAPRFERRWFCTTNDPQNRMSLGSSL